jgi:two-component system response regulator (stage 0 sporulation protein F)
MSSEDTIASSNGRVPAGSDATGADDRRRHPRTPVMIPATLEASGKRRIDCTLLDLSARGARVAVKGSLAKGESVMLSSPDLGKMRAVVTRVEPDCVGLEFVGRDQLSSEQSALPGILVVEDEEKMRELIRRILERARYTVTAAAHGREALKLFQERPVDVAITDLLMPEMDGFQLIRELTARWPSIRIIAISGADMRLEMARRLGAKAVLRKPISGARLVQTVEQVLANP